MEGLVGNAHSLEATSGSMATDIPHSSIETAFEIQQHFS